jgi:hypothetical protein
LAFALVPPLLVLGLTSAKLVLTLTPGLFLAVTPFIPLLIRKPCLLIPLAVVIVVVTGLAELVVTAPIIVALTIPLASLCVLLLCPALLFC